MKKYKLCQNCTYFSNVKTEEITKSSLKIEEFVEVKKKNFLSTRLKLVFKVKKFFF